MLADVLTQPAARIAAALTVRGETVSVAESSAGGLISAALLCVPGASAYYKGGVVIYTLESVRELLGGAREDLEPGRRGAAEPLGRYLAASVAAKLGTDWALGETGATGPDANPYGDPGGHAWVALAGPGSRLEAAHVLTGTNDRVTNMETFAARALALLDAALSSG